MSERHHCVVADESTEEQGCWVARCPTCGWSTQAEEHLDCTEAEACLRADLHIAQSELAALREQRRVLRARVLIVAQVLAATGITAAASELLAALDATKEEP